MDRTAEKINFKELKKSGRKVVKSHYLFLLITLLISAFIGSEFSDAMTIFTSEGEALRNLIQLPAQLIHEGEQIFGHTNGVFASLLTSFGSGTIYDSIFLGISSILNSELAGLIILIIISLFLSFIVWYLFSNIFSVSARRIFLESRIYKNIIPQRFLFTFSVKQWMNVCRVMLVKYIYNFLWYFVFLVGGVIKHYSYFLVPFILAENPTLTAKQAINLSRKMMYGHKWECFLLDLSFIGWLLLRIITLGISGIFYSNMYQVAAHTEYYVKLRVLAKESSIDGCELLNDEYLYKRADKETLDATYGDIVSVLNGPQTAHEKPKNAIEFIFDLLGITLSRKHLNEERDLQIVRQDNAKAFLNILNGNQYPARLFTIPTRFKDVREENLNYIRKYSLVTVVLMFFIFAFIGWIWEVSLFFVNEGRFVNRGMLHGPWLPIYGSGGLLILTLLYKLRKNSLVQFFSAVVLCGLVEYFTAFALEIIHDGQKWWDYTGYFLNLHGRICAEGLLVFGLGGVAVVYLLAPLLDNLLKKANQKILAVIACILVIIFAADAVYSGAHPNTGEGITQGEPTTQALNNE